MIFNYAVLLACAFMVKSKNLPDNNTAIISTYAKVAHWGAVSTSTEEAQSEGRSHSGQALWTHRSEANIVGGQNLKPKVVYQYPIHKVGQVNQESGQGVGEVQERFNPRPYFDYTHLPPKSQSAKVDSKPKNKPDATPPATFDSFPVFNSPPATPTDLYTSQFNSYIPPSSGPVGPPVNSKPDASYSPDTDDGNGGPDDSDSPPGYSYDPPQDKPPAPKGPPPSKPTLGPPLAPHPPKGQLYYPPADDQDDKEQLFYPPSDNQDQKQLYYPPSSNGHKPAYHPHGHKEQLYYPPSEDGSAHETILDHPPPGWQDTKGMSDMGPPDMGGPPDVGGPPDLTGPGDMKAMGGASDMKGNGMKGSHDMGEDDLSPPPSPDFGGQFPQYLYNGHGQGHDQGHDFDYDFDHHHVYKEVTTTTEAPEDERVNKGHYSYYYLGRKLWYIPLYFSVYFILYVTVLILKSIARHKIQFKHQYLKKDMAKDMSKDMGHGRSFDIDELHDNVTTAIDTSRRKFTYVAM